MTQLHSIRLASVKHGFYWNWALKCRLCLELLLLLLSGVESVLPEPETLVDDIKLKSLGPFQF